MLPLADCAAHDALFDDATGIRTVVNTPPCRDVSRTPPYIEVESSGAPWVLFGCLYVEKLYNVITPRWSAFRCAGACPGPRTAHRKGARIGARWVELYYQLPGPCGDGIHYDCGPATMRFMGLASHRVRAAATDQRLSREAVA